MKREITIIQKHKKEITVTDISDVTQDEFLNKISEVFKMNDIVILKFTEKDVIIRPSMIISMTVTNDDVTVTDIQTSVAPPTKVKPKNVKAKPKVKSEVKSENFLTDGKK